MGFLDHATNGILLDCVLTDAGRQALARNDGSFSVVKFSLSDEEVDYTVISKYGRTVGKEKIEKNTPVFEAITNQNLAQKYHLISISNQFLIRLPIFELNGVGVDGTTNTVSMGRLLTKTATLTVSQTIENESSIDVELRDQAFIVEMNNNFLQILKNRPSSIDGQQRAKYILTRSPVETPLGGSTVTMTLQVKSLTEQQFQVFGSTNNKNRITTYVRVTGVQSGAVTEFRVNIDKTS